MSLSDPQNSDAGNLNPMGARPEARLPVVSSVHRVVGEAPVPQGAGSTPDTGALLKALRRRWLLAITLGLIAGGVLAGATWLFLPKAKHTARTLLYVRAQQPILLYSNNEEQHPDPTSYQRTQAALVKSRMVLNAALRDVGDLTVLHAEETDPVETLERLLIVDFTLGPEIMRISISGDDEDELVLLVNKVSEAYDKEILMKDREERESHLNDFKKVREDAMRNFKSRQDEFSTRVAFADAADPFSLSLHRMLLSIELKDAQTQMGQAQNELRVLRSSLKVEQDRESNPDRPTIDPPVHGASAMGFFGSSLEQARTVAASASATAEGARGSSITRNSGVSVDVERALKTDPSLLKLAEQRDTLAKQIQETIPVVNGENHPKVVELREKLKVIDDSIAERKREVRPILEKEAALLRGAAAQSNLAQLKDRIARAENFEKTVLADIDRLTKATEEVGVGGKKTLDLDRYRIEVAAAEETYKRANAAVESLQVELKAPSRVKTLEKGILTHGNDLKRRAIASAAAGLGGFGFLLLGISFLEFRSRKIQSADEVTAGTGLRVVGTLPALPTGRKRAMDAQGDAYWRDLMTESVDAIRTLLLYTAQKDDLRIVMVTSAVGSEGKTSLSSHLAASLARAGRKTLLVDCDLRKPAAHRMFDLQQTPGFSEVLRGETTVADAVQPTQADTLSVIAAGLCDRAALQALAHGAAGPIFQQLREQYEFIVVDTAPVLPVADSLLVGEHVDAVVFSILRDISRMPRVHAAYQRLAMLGIRMLGAVVNGTREDAYGTDYNYASVKN